VVGAENIGGTVDQKDMVALGKGFGGNGFWGGALGCFRHGRNLGIFAPIDSLYGTIQAVFATALVGITGVVAYFS
jgi:hypothetical protein